MHTAAASRSRFTLRPGTDPPQYFFILSSSLFAMRMTADAEAERKANIFASDSELLLSNALYYGKSAHEGFPLSRTALPVVQ